MTTREPESMTTHDPHLAAALFARVKGKQLVGRTRLQTVASVTGDNLQALPSD